MSVSYKYRAVFFSAVVLFLCVWMNEIAEADQSRPLQVVASSTLFADLVKHVGGERVTVKSVASPKFNVHFYEPKPSDVQNVRKADVFVRWGLDIEAWSGPLLDAAGKPALFFGGERNIDLSGGIELKNIPQTKPSRAQGDIHLHGNPHYPMNPENMRVMATTLRDRLKDIDPEGAKVYEKNTDVFLAKLNQKISEWKALCAHCQDKEVISYHDDIIHLADFLGIRSKEFLQPKSGIQPTPKHIEYLEKYMKERNINAIVMPTYFSKSSSEQLASHIGGKVVTVCQNAGEVPGTQDVFGFYDYNIQQISEAL